MFDWIRKLLKGSPPPSADDPYVEFVREFIAECQRQHLVIKSYDQATRSFAFTKDDGTQVSLFMQNTFGEWQQRDPARRAELIARFVRSLFESHADDTISPEKITNELMPGIRSQVLISSTMIRNWISGGPNDDSGAGVFSPFVADLVMCAVRDQRDSMSLLTRAQLAKAALSFDQAMQQAMVNFREKLPPPMFEPLGDGLFGCANLEDYQSSLLLLTPGKDYALPPIDGAPVAAVPGRNVFYLTGAQNPVGLARLLDIASKTSETPHSCSASLLQWNGECWSEQALTDDKLDLPRQEILRHQLARDYSEQKQLLDQYHNEQGQDIFVANATLYRIKDGSKTFSAATLASGAQGTLLPWTDRLVFVKQIIDPGTGLAEGKPQDIVDVAWPDAMNIVGHLFEPVAYCYPPRLRALGFPDAEAWARLKAVGR